MFFFFFSFFSKLWSCKNTSYGDCFSCLAWEIYICSTVLEIIIMFVMSLVTLSSSVFQWAQWHPNFYLLCASSHGRCSVEMTSCSRMDLEIMSSLCAEGGLPCLRLLLIYSKTLKCSMILSCHVFYWATVVQSVGGIKIWPLWNVFWRSSICPNMCEAIIAKFASNLTHSVLTACGLKRLML